MEFKKCSRCGNFYVSNGMVCPKCTPKDDFEFSSFKSYVERNGLDSIDTIALETGISVKNINRFMEYNSSKENLNLLNNSKIKNDDLAASANEMNNNGITFLI